MANQENLEPYKLKPGESLPGHGRPKGARSMKTILREMLELVVDTPRSEIAKQWTNEGKIKIKDALVMKDMLDALKGNERSKQRIWEYMEGKPDQTQSIELKTPQTPEEIRAKLQSYADSHGMNLEEYCTREGIDIDQFDEVKQIDRK